MKNVSLLGIKMVSKVQETSKVVYRKYVVFREMKDVVKEGVLSSKEEQEKIEFDLKDNESKSTEE